MRFYLPVFVLAILLAKYAYPNAATQSTSSQSPSQSEVASPPNWYAASDISAVRASQIHFGKASLKRSYIHRQDHISHGDITEGSMDVCMVPQVESSQCASMWGMRYLVASMPRCQLQTWNPRRQTAIEKTTDVQPMGAWFGMAWTRTTARSSALATCQQCPKDQQGQHAQTKKDQEKEQGHPGSRSAMEQRRGRDPSSSWSPIEPKALNLLPLVYRRLSRN